MFGSYFGIACVLRDILSLQKRRLQCCILELVVLYVLPDWNLRLLKNYKSQKATDSESRFRDGVCVLFCE